MSTVIIIVAISFLGYSVYAFNYIPFIQSQAFQKSPNFVSNADLAAKRLKEAMRPYNFAQYNIRSSGIDEHFMDKFFYNPDYMGNRMYWPVADLLIEGMDELGKREPYDVRILLREVEMLNAKAKYLSEEEAAPLFIKSEELMREAVKRAPNRQEVYYHLAFNLAGQKRYDESIVEAQYAVSLNSNIPRAHYHLALMYMLAGRNEQAAKELDIVQGLHPDLGGLLVGDINTVLKFYDSIGNMDKVAEFIIKDLEKTINHKFARQYYEKSLGYFAEKEDLPHFLEVANYLKTFDDLKEDMETFIDFVKNGVWDIKYVYNGGSVDKIAELLIKSFDEKITKHKFNKVHYESMLGYFIHNEDRTHTLQIAGYLANFPDLKDNMEVIIDLIKKGNWEVIHNTLGI